MQATYRRPRRFSTASRAPILVMQAVQHGAADDFARPLFRRSTRYPLSHALMDARPTAIVDKCLRYPSKLTLSEDQHVMTYGR